jgi:hypothetical protein
MPILLSSEAGAHFGLYVRALSFEGVSANGMSSQVMKDNLMMAGPLTAGSLQWRGSS